LHVPMCVRVRMAGFVVGQGLPFKSRSIVYPKSLIGAIIALINEI
jgi:hypothetical protein